MNSTGLSPITGRRWSKTERAQAAQVAVKRRECRHDFGRWCEIALAKRGLRPAAHHRLLIARLQAVAEGKIPRLLVTQPPGSAKALALDTPIPTPTGWTTMGQIRIGEELFDERGQICRVTWKSQVWHDRPVYRVMTDCGDTIVADAEHEWLVCLDRKPRKPPKRPEHHAVLKNRDDPLSRFKIKETRDLARKRSKRPMIKRAGALQLPERELPIDPYLFGVWLGDGHSSGARITSGDQDRGWVRSEIESLGYRTTDQSFTKTFGVLGVRGCLVNLGVVNDPHHRQFGSKHIPDIYLRAGLKQRKDLLQGLIDTDGTVAPFGEVTYCSTNPRLASNVAELVRSLGVKASICEGRAKLNGKDCGTVWKIHFFMKDAARLPRKREKTKNGIRTPNTYVDVDRFGIADTVCIEVDSPSHLFLCGASMTPTHNSTFVSQLFPPWLFAYKPGQPIIGASHTAELAEDFSLRIHRFVKENEQVLGYRLASENRGRWYTTNDGSYVAVGVGAAVTGRRAALGIIDDPVKGRQAADSEAARKHVWEWYLGDFERRLIPEAPIVLVLTRWHEGDLAGLLLETQPERWDVLNLPAEAEENDPLGRAPGEWLWSDDDYGYGASLPQIKADLEAAGASREWVSQYQGHPRPAEGAIFRIDRIGVLSVAPAGGRTVRAYDLAATAASGARDPDWTRGVKLTLLPNKRLVIENVVGARGGPDEVERLLVNTAGQDGRDVRIGLPQDPGQAGKVQVAYLTKLLHGYRVESSPESGKKETRAGPIASQVNVGNVDLVEGPWNRAFLDELAAFDSGAHDDQVDALSRAYSMLIDQGKPLILSPQQLIAAQRMPGPQRFGGDGRNRFGRVR